MKLVKFNSFDSQVPTSFTGFLDKLMHDSLGTDLKQFTPAVDIAEDEKCYEIHLALAGAKKQAFKIDLNDGKLTISGERKFEKHREGKNFHCLETQYGSFSRSFIIPEDVVKDQVEAFYEDGILTIILPKRERKILKTSIEIK